MVNLGWLLVGAIGADACTRELAFRSHHRHVRRQSGNVTFPPSLTRNEQILVKSFDATSISEWSYYYTHGRALAGENKTMAQWTADRWSEFGFESRLDGYHVYLNYPVSQSIELKHTNGSVYKPTLQEDVLEIDETTSYPDRVPAFHGYSFSGEASAEFVYVGRGQQADFNRLVDLNVELEGKVALAKYGGPFRGLKVKNAQEHGMIGVITFTDPGDDGNMTVAKGKVAYPNGPARNPTSIQRGSVQFLSTYPGDPTTPGYPSRENSTRMEKLTIPRIPSLPISWIEAQPLLKALNDHGTVGEQVNRTRWVGAIPGVKYNTGPAPGVTIAMSNIAEDKTNWIWNAIGIINGTNEDEVVVVGNHRDAWMIGGAADPHSGSAILVELAKAFGELTKTGWKPKRTIVLASWDAEEYGLIGSTEWVEEFVPWLKDAAVSYLNVDVGVSGTVPDFSATPDLHRLATSVAKKIVWPRWGNRTLYDAWEEANGEIGAMGAQSDYTAFLHRGGIAAIDMGTTRAPTDPIYHYHSNYDSYYWMSTFADPGFVLHKAMGQYLTLFLYHLANDDVLPLEPRDYVPELHAYFKELTRLVAGTDGAGDLDLATLEDAISIFEDSAKQFDTARLAAASDNAELLRTLNHKARDFSRGFISQGGLPDREFYQHLVFAPGLDTGYAPVTFPGVTEALTAGHVAEASVYVGKTADAIKAAAAILGA